MAGKLNKKKLLTFLTEIGEQKGISKEQIVDILKESFILAFSKKFEDEMYIQDHYVPKNKDDVRLAPALIKCDINLKKGTIVLARQWLVLEDDDIKDDFIEISVDDPKVQEQNLSVNDYYEEPLSFDDLEQKYVYKFKSNFQQKISKAEKEGLIETYKEKIGEIVNGTVVKTDLHSVIVELSIGKYSATLYDGDLIGKETFTVGENIKVFIKGIGKDSKDAKNSGNLVKISRSCEGFLRKLFEQEVHEIYDGTVIVKGVVRKAGIRSKVAVYTNNPDVDPCGACIGPGGQRIQAIVSQLGKQVSDTADREKIDVINYHENRGLFLAEALRPGTMIGAKFSEDGKRALAVCTDDSRPYAIGKHRINLLLAAELLRLEDIQVLTETEANEQKISYTTIEEFELQEKTEQKRKTREIALKLQEEKIKKEEEEKAKLPPEEVKKEEVPVYAPEEEFYDDYEETEVAVQTEEPAVEKLEDVATPKVEEKPKDENVETVKVSTTISLSALEKSLETEKKQKEAKKPTKKKKVEEQKVEKDKADLDKPIKKMDIYTEEELKEFEDEELMEDSYDSEYDDYFSEYDDDEYYSG